MATLSIVRVTWFRLCPSSQEQVKIRRVSLPVCNTCYHQGAHWATRDRESASLAAPCSLFCLLWLQSSLWRRQEISPFENVSITLFNLSLYLFSDQLKGLGLTAFLQISVWCATFCCRLCHLLSTQRCVWCVDVIFFYCFRCCILALFNFYLSIK